MALIDCAAARSRTAPFSESATRADAQSPASTGCPAARHAATCPPTRPRAARYHGYRNATVPAASSTYATASRLSHQYRGGSGLTASVLIVASLQLTEPIGQVILNSGKSMSTAEKSNTPAP